MALQNMDVNEYYNKLDQLAERCDRLISHGQPYLAVILCHELYRYTYPVEPYANFTHDNPVIFMNDHITKILELADTFSTVVMPYSIDMDIKNEAGISLEKETSDLYSGLWKNFDKETLTQESLKLIKNRIPDQIVKSSIKNGRILDMGCGSGRYSIALSLLGAGEVIGVDYQAKAFAAAQDYSSRNSLNVKFQESNVLNLPFENESFDFVFCNGVLHHTSSIEKGIRELSRVLKKPGKAFLYLYGSGGIFWTTRNVMRQIFKKIPLGYTKNILNIIGMPPNRFIFCDTWYVPVETHTKEKDLHEMLTACGFAFKKVVSSNAFDIDYPIQEGKIPMAKEMWGEGEHRYILTK